MRTPNECEPSEPKCVKVMPSCSTGLQPRSPVTSLPPHERISFECEASRECNHPAPKILFDKRSVVVGSANGHDGFRN